LSGIRESDKTVLHDAPVSPSELFGTAVEMVVDRFREARTQSGHLCISLVWSSLLLNHLLPHQEEVPGERSRRRVWLPETPLQGVESRGAGIGRNHTQI